MPKIEWNPLINGEEIHGNRLTSIGAKIRSSLNNPDADDNVTDRAFGVDSCGTDSIQQSASMYLASTHSLKTVGGALQGDLWPGNCRTGEPKDCQDPKWQDTFTDVDIPSIGHQITVNGSSGSKFGWRFLIEARFDRTIDLLGDNSNSILVLSEAHVTELYSQFKTQKSTRIASTPHVLLFIVIVAVIIDSDGNRYKIPLPSTVRFTDADTNTNNSCLSNSPWITGGVGGWTSAETALTNLRKNLPVRTLVTYSDINSASFKGDAGPTGSARYASKASGKEYKKRVDSFQLYACLKPCSGTWHGRGTGSYEARGSIREKLLDAIYFSSTHAESETTTITYP